MAQVDPRVLSTLKKIQALIGSPNSGESAAAQRKLEKALKQYNLTPSDLDDAVSDTREYRVGYWNNHERNLLFQCIAKVIHKSTWKYRQGTNYVYIYVTPSEYAQIYTLFYFYSEVYDRELKLFQQAFFDKHHLYNPDGDPQEVDVDTHLTLTGIQQKLQTVVPPDSHLKGASTKMLTGSSSKQ